MPVVHGVRVGGESGRNGMPPRKGYVYHGSKPYLGPDRKEKKAVETEAEREPHQCEQCGYLAGGRNCRVLCA